MADKLAEENIRNSLGASGGWDERNDEKFFDTSTGAFNRDALNVWGQTEIDIARRQNIPITVAMFDIDFFKQKNDSIGHPETDILLKKTIGDLKTTLREADLLFRYGGDEFVILLLDNDLNNSKEVVMPKVEKVFSQNGLQISTGIHEIGKDETLQEVLKIVDADLYKIKSQKKNE